MSIQQNFPGFSPSLNLNFARSKRLDPRVTFVRQTGATVTNELGLLERVGNNIPRFDHVYDSSTGTVRSLGLLVEEQRENLVDRSNDYSGSPGGWTLSSTGTRAQDIVGPDGVANSAWTITDNDSAGDFARFYKQISITPSLSTNYCISSFVKDINGTGISPEFYVFLLGSSTKGSRIVYNFSTDTITAFSSDGGGISPSIYGRILYPNGWVRIYFVVNDANDGGNNTLQYRIYPNGRDAGRTGAMGFYGTQIEVGAFPTSYIPTAGLPTTRLADRATIDGQNFSSWYNQIEGTYFMSTKIAHTPNPNVSLLFRTVATGGPRVSLEQTTSNTLVGIVENSGAYFFSTSGSGLVPANQFRKTSLSYISTNGTTTVGAATNLSTLVDTVSSIDVSKSLNTLYLGRYTDTFYYLNGHIQQFVYYPRKISNSQLQQLTR